MLKGNSYLANLTLEIPIDTNLTLRKLYALVDSKYVVYCPDSFLCFSPETFLQINGRQVSTFPIKGTIKANSVEEAKTILTDFKESAEHATVVDLLRNDLSMIADGVFVEKYQYLESITTNHGNIYQVVSKITGTLKPHFEPKRDIHAIITRMLPAGSVTGAPKHKTTQILSRVETHDRGFYTGIAGGWNGDSFDSCVLIRFIEQRGKSLFYKTGVGITVNSDPQKEYEELLQKIYLPIPREYMSQIRFAPKYPLSQ